jgi:hypothetical protein
MKKYLEYLLEIVLSAVLIRSLLIGPTIGESLLLICLVISITYKTYYIEKNRIDDKEDINKQIEELKNAITSMKLNTSIRKAANEKEPTNLSIRRF